MATRIQIRRDAAANWASVNPISAQGEFCYETDTGILKIGNGITAYNLLPALLTSGSGPSATPSAPTSLLATPGGEQVFLQWDAPASGGTSPISDYRIESSPPTSNTWTLRADSVSTATTATVSGLTNGVTLAFRVAAINSAGTGPFSNTATAAPVAPATHIAMTQTQYNAATKTSTTFYPIVTTLAAPTTIANYVYLTQVEFDALASKSATTIYRITTQPVGFPPSATVVVSAAAYAALTPDPNTYYKLQEV